MQHPEDLFPKSGDDDFKPYPIDEPRWGGSGPTDANAEVIEDDD